MAKKKRQSREEWEQELWEKQVNLTVSHVKIKSIDETFNTAGLIWLVLGIILLALGVTAFSWKTPYGLIGSLSAVLVGLCLILRILIGQH
jgi:phosphatidylserine synthase